MNERSDQPKPDLRMSGAEYKAYMAADWGHPDAHYDDYTVYLDGVEVSDVDDTKVADTALLEFWGGVVYLGNRDMSLKAHFNRWKRAQTVRYVTVEIPVDKLDELKAAVKALRGKVTT